MLVLGRGTIN